MHGIVVTNWKKKALFGAGLLLFIVIAITIGVYATNRADANQSSTSVSTPEEANMKVDVKVNNGSVEPESSANVESNSVPSSDQQSQTNATNPNVDVQVDGTAIDVPENGSVHKRITNENGSTSIDVSSQSNTSSGDSRTRSSINIDVDSSVRVRSSTRE